MRDNKKITSNNFYNNITINNNTIEHKYKIGTIYKLVIKDTNEIIYVGSTCRAL